MHLRYGFLSSVAPWVLAVGLAALAMATRLEKERRSAHPDRLGDTHYHIDWGEQAHVFGLFRLYSVPHEISQERWGRHAINYGPAFAYYVWAQNALRRVLWGDAPYYHPGMLLSLLVPQGICYVLTGWVLMTLLRPSLGRGGALFGAILFWLNPGMLSTAAYHGQTDAFICLVMLLSLHLASQGRWVSTGAVWMVGVLVKPQPILIAPVLGYLLLRRGTWRDRRGPCLSALVVLFIVAGPFVLANDDWPSRLGWWDRAYRASFSIWNRTTNKAYNLWWLDAVLIGRQTGDWPGMDPARTIAGLPRSDLGLVLLGLVVVWGVHWMSRWGWADLRTVSAVSGLIAIAAFLFLTRMWDRYLGYGLALIIPWAVVDRRVLCAYGVMSLAWFVNLLHSVHVRACAAGWPVPPVWVTGMVCAVLCLGGFVVLWVHLTREDRTTPSAPREGL